MELRYEVGSICYRRRLKTLRFRLDSLLADECIKVGNHE